MKSDHFITRESIPFCVVGLLVIAVASTVIGGPINQSYVLKDQQTMEELLTLESQLQWLFVGRSTFPETVAEAKERARTKSDISYTRFSSTTFELCADFKTTSKGYKFPYNQSFTRSTQQASGFYAHPAGRHCYRFSVEPSQVELNIQSLATIEARKKERIDRLGIKNAVILERVLADVSRVQTRSGAFRDLINLGTEALEAAPSISALANRSGLVFREQAILTLGYIQDKLSSPNLNVYLLEKYDWRVNQAAAFALGMMEVEESKADLALVANSHWFPPVREAARIAIERIENRMSAKAIEELALKEVFDGPASLNSLTDCETLNGTEVPLTLKFPNGRLTGTHKGRQGGSLKFYPSPNNVSKVVLHSNIHGVFQIGEAVYAISTDKLEENYHGVVSRLQEATAGEWKVLSSTVLPGYPIRIVRSPDGKIFISTLHGAPQSRELQAIPPTDLVTVQLSSAGELSMFDCHRD